MLTPYQSDVQIPVGDATVDGQLTIPEDSHGIVIFAHGSGSSRFSPRNQMVAKFLWQNQLGTLLFDLLTAEEDMNRQYRFNIELLARRLVLATEWLERQPEVATPHFGYFGASTGAAAALMAAAALPQIEAVVSRGGRPDLAMPALPDVQAPTLLIVGGMDKEVLALNRTAQSHLKCENRLEIIVGATHLFEETGAMEKVCVLAASWFENYLQPVKLIRET
jgi:putative phosphoribosyl transferase